MSAAQVVALAFLLAPVLGGAIYSWLWGEGTFAGFFVFLLGLLTLVVAVTLLLGMLLTGLFPWQGGFWS